MELIGDRILQLRKELSLTQEEFGNKIGIKKSSMSSIEKNKSNPSEQTIKFICKEFNVNYGWLVDGKGEIFIDTDRTTIELLADDYKLRPVEVSLIEEFVKLDEEERNVLLNYLQNVFLKNGQ